MRNIDIEYVKEAHPPLMIRSSRSYTIEFETDELCHRMSHITNYVVNDDCSIIVENCIADEVKHNHLFVRQLPGVNELFYDGEYEIAGKEIDKLL